MNDRAHKPLAFVQGTGLLLQTVGGVMAIGLCCIGSFGANAIGEAAAENAMLMTVARLELFLSIAAGLAYAALGLGLQQVRRSAAVAALLTSILMTLFWAAALLIGVREHVRAAAHVIAIVFLLINGGLAGFCWGSLVILLQAGPEDFATIHSQVRIEDLSEEELNKPIH